MGAVSAGVSAPISSGFSRVGYAGVQHTDIQDVLQRALSQQEARRRRRYRRFWNTQSPHTHAQLGEWNDVYDDAHHSDHENV